MTMLRVRRELFRFFRPAPTYETASTRKYFHGRTETVRSCTQEAVDFAKTILNPASSVRNTLVEIVTEN